MCGEIFWTTTEKGDVFWTPKNFLHGYPADHQEGPDHSLQASPGRHQAISTMVPIWKWIFKSILGADLFESFSNYYINETKGT